MISFCRSCSATLAAGDTKVCVELADRALKIYCVVCASCLLGWEDYDRFITDARADVRALLNSPKRRPMLVLDEDALENGAAA